MAYEEPTTPVTGTVISTSSFGVKVVNSIKALWKGTTAGDTDYYDTATTKARLPIGNYGDVLAVNSSATAPEWKATTTTIGGVLHKQLLLSNITALKTAGCQLPQVYEMTTNKNCYVGCAFDKDTQEYGFTNFALPDDYKSGGDIYIKVYWFHQAGTAYKVSWAIEAVAINDNETLDVTLGTEVTMNDTGGTNNNLYISPLSSACTIKNTPSAGKLVNLNLSRKATDGTNDTLDADAIATMIMVWYPVN